MGKSGGWCETCFDLVVQLVGVRDPRLVGTGSWVSRVWAQARGASVAFQTDWPTRGRAGETPPVSPSAGADLSRHLSADDTLV